MQVHHTTCHSAFANEMSNPAPPSIPLDGGADHLDMTILFNVAAAVEEEKRKDSQIERERVGMGERQMLLLQGKCDGGRRDGG